ncbi:MAG: class I SAM-dependent methyltransferase [Pyrinomonadaceae bacterium]|jgi:SAM-dependent methyltransferase|nr:class I SAM-dependent methyltransferase [Pyrinomonadaceae bacterium]
MFDFREINCPVYEVNHPKFVGYRGGEAHHGGLGIKTSIVRCQKCSHQYPNPMPFPQNSLDELYHDADEYFAGSDVEGLKKNALKIIGEFEQKLGRKGRFLDVGCGVGYMLWAAKELGWEVVEGVDPSKAFIETGKNRLGVNGKAMFLHEANFPENYFDGILMSSILEHLYNPIETLNEVRRVLNPNGYFHFDVPNEDGLYMKFGNVYMRLRGKDWVVVMAPTFPPYHVQGFNPKSLKKLMNRAGLEIKELNMCGGVWDLTGEQTLRKKIETKLAKLINSTDKALGGGLFMIAWCQKK